MVGTALTKDVGAFFQGAAGNGDNWVQAGGHDGAAVLTPFVDRTGFGSMKLLVPFTAVLTAAATLTVNLGAQDATDNAGTGAADFGTFSGAKVVATGPGGGGTVNGVAEIDMNVEGARQFLAGKVTATLSHAADTVQLGRVLCLGGATEEPCSKRLN